MPNLPPFFFLRFIHDPASTERFIYIEPLYIYEEEIKEVREMKEESAKRKMVIMVGAPAAGKSTYRKKWLSWMDSVDCDEVAEFHPDYDPKNPGKTHAWASEVAWAVALEYMREGKSFVYDGTGANLQKYKTLIDEAHKMGYFVQMVYLTISLEESLKRNSQRERTVAPEVVKNKFFQVEKAVNTLSRLVDKVQVVD